MAWTPRSESTGGTRLYDAIRMSTGPPEPSCPRCGASIPAGARFCMSCGEPVAAATESDLQRLTSLSAAAPLPLIEKMRAAKLTGERKPVTALFVDVVGSTALLEHMDPEDWTAIINEAFDLMSKAVFRYEGTIAQLQGDAMLAFFGAPVAHEDDPERAVRAALDMIESVASLRPPAEDRPRHRLPDPGRHQHGAGPGRQRGHRPALRVHGARRRGERGGPRAGRRRAGDGPHHRGHASAAGRPVRRRGPRRASTSRARPSRSTSCVSSASGRLRAGAADWTPSASTARWSDATSISGR